MFKKKMRVQEFIQVMIFSNLQSEQDIQVNPAVFDENEKKYLERLMKIYKISLGWLHIAGKDSNKQNICKLPEHVIWAAEDTYLQFLNDAVARGLMNNSERALFDQTSEKYFEIITTTTFHPEKPYFHHIDAFVSIAYPRENQKRKKEHLFDYCSQQHKALEKTFFRKIKLVIR